MDETKEQLIVSTSPHAHAGDSVPKIMLSVIASLIPTFVMAVYFFGWNAVRLTLACCTTCVISEYVCRKMMKRDPGITDLSAVVTGVLLAFNLPPGLPAWMAVIGSMVAIVIGKQVYGGIGYNPFNPALVGRVFLLISYPVAMTTWLTSCPAASGVDAVATATPLGLWKTAWSAGAAPVGYFDKFPLVSLIVGEKPGCIGEVPTLALILGGLYLIWRKCVYWQTPVCYIGTVAAFSGILRAVDPVHNLSPLYHLLTGGLMLGAFFMATDMVTSPVTKKGMAVFGVGCGILTMLIRKWGGYPEGVSFAILIMNGLTPLINRATRPRVFGHSRRKADRAKGS